MRLSYRQLRPLPQRDGDAPANAIRELLPKRCGCRAGLMFRRLVFSAQLLLAIDMGLRGRWSGAGERTPLPHRAESVPLRLYGLDCALRQVST